MEAKKILASKQQTYTYLLLHQVHSMSHPYRAGKIKSRVLNRWEKQADKMYTEKIRHEKATAFTGTLLFLRRLWLSIREIYDKSHT